jgi:hypothetical protein
MSNYISGFPFEVHGTFTCFLKHTNIRGALHYYHVTEQEVSLKLRMLCRSKVDNKGLIRHQFSREKEKRKHL